MELLVEAGADSEILYQQKPHIGTDRLSQVVACIREEILALGGEVRFNTQVTDFIMEQGRITGLVAGGTEQMEAEAVVLAVGHSARDTFETLLARNIWMEQMCIRDSCQRVRGGLRPLRTERFCASVPGERGQHQRHRGPRGTGLLPHQR